MKYIFLMIMQISVLEATAKELIAPEFVIVVPSYKNERWAIGNLKSVCHQKSTQNYQVICIDDCSPDRTGELMDEYVRENNLESRVTIIHNKQRVGALANIYNTIHMLVPDDKIVILVDGDDQLSSNDVLLYLEKVYQDPYIWMTWGQAQNTDGELIAGDFPYWVWPEKYLRSFAWIATHLRTFRASLFKKIERSDLLYNNEFFPVTWDMAIMFPMLEMCSPKNVTDKPHARFISEVLYLYNDVNPISDIRSNHELTLSLDNHIRRNMTPYEPLDSL